MIFAELEFYIFKWNYILGRIIYRIICLILRLLRLKLSDML